MQFSVAMHLVGFISRIKVKILDALTFDLES